MGVAPLQQYLVELDRGRLQALDLAWDTVRGRWFHLYPDEDMSAGNGLHWTGSYKNWQSRCAVCHQT
ncbi:cytochrome C family protein, partial [Rhizobiaceae sp. 2RAB30]